MVLGLLLGVLAARPAAGQEPIISAAPIVEYDADGGHYFWRFLGPIGEWSERANGRKLEAIRPLFSRYEDPATEYLAQDVLWPVYVSRWVNGQKIRRGALSEDITKDYHDPNSEWHYFLYPFYFQGRDPDGNGYFGLFPFGGRLTHAFTYDKVCFIGFPLYLTLDRHHIHSLHLMWPIYARVEGPKRYKEHVFPLFGVARTKEKWENRFVLWPFINWGHSLSPDITGNAFFLFPLYGRMSVHETKTNKLLVENRTLLWPFLSGMRTSKGMRLYFPWPFFQWSEGMDGPDTSSLWFWPLYGESFKKGEKRHFWIWPVFLHISEEKSAVHGERFYALPLYWQNLQTIKGQPYDTYRRFWPFLSYHETPDHRVLVRVLDLWPARRSLPIDRNFTPLWTLYSYRSSNEGSRHDLLWGFWEHERRKGKTMREQLFPLYSFTRFSTGKARTWNFLTGLIGTQDAPDGAVKLKLLWFIKLTLWHHQPDGGQPAPPAETEAPATAAPEAAPPATPPPAGPFPLSGILEPGAAAAAAGDEDSLGGVLLPTLSPLIPPVGL